jgi:hypothetical protein
MSVPMYLVSRPPDNNRLRPQAGAGRAARASEPDEVERALA